MPSNLKPLVEADPNRYSTSHLLERIHALEEKVHGSVQGPTNLEELAALQEKEAAERKAAEEAAAKAKK